MNDKRAFLLARGREFELESMEGLYDPKRQLSFSNRNPNIPVVAESDFGRTQSKTMQAPGDDDPDPEDEGCY